MTPIASTPDPLAFLVVPRPTEIDPLRDAPPLCSYLTLIVERARPTVPNGELPLLFMPVVCIDRDVVRSRELEFWCRGDGAA